MEIIEREYRTSRASIVVDAVVALEAIIDSNNARWGGSLSPSTHGATNFFLPTPSDVAGEYVAA